MPQKLLPKLRHHNISTTIREPRRTHGFFIVLKKYFEGKKWNPQKQEQFQIRLIQHKLYKPEKIPPKYTNQHKCTECENSFCDVEKCPPMEWKMAKEIWAYQRDVVKNNTYRNDKVWYGYRGRMSFKPLMKLGFCYIDNDKKVVITELGQSIIDQHITFEAAMASTLLKYQIPESEKDPLTKMGYSIKPLIATLHLINKVNQLWVKVKKGNKPKGISREEFNLFVCSLTKKEDIELHAKNLIEFRKKIENQKNKTKQTEIALMTILKLNYHLTENQRKTYLQNYNTWLVKFNSRKKSISYTKFCKENKDDLNSNYETLKEYGDNMRRYFQMSEWISVRGGRYLDLNPRKRVETESLLKFDPGEPKRFKDGKDYSKWIGDDSKPIWPWKTKKILVEMYLELQKNIEELKSKLSSTTNIPYLQSKRLTKISEKQIEKEIEKLKPKLLELDMKSQKTELESVEKIQEVIDSLDINYMKHESARESFVEFEYQSTRGLMALDDGVIKPNYHSGIDGQPTSHAGAGLPDIECFYHSFNMVCEVTLLSNEQQWKAEGTSVPDHFENFIRKNQKNKNFCIFVAPQIHQRTTRTFYQNNQWSENEFGRTIPLTISQFIEILETLKKIRSKKPAKGISHEKMEILYQKIIDSMSLFPKGRFLEWRNNIQSILNKWKQTVIV